ncbi:hypothetical protein DYB32_010244 [Aphanomyces invadans]|uniref:HECT-type E3 ubiquitin transferase n=1 Tax=Aphanomyces invadans TaxID=157072 RepID=A0A3R6YYJ2_9STRA|nr:hypothetical protein DYB32_010244 [Aphanomyces invadans]
MTIFPLPTSFSSNVGDASSPPRDTDDQKIAWTPLELVDGNYTVMGTKLADPLWRALLSVSEMKFTCKYAWFLEQAASLVVPYEVKYLVVAQALMDPGTGLFVLASKDSHMYIPNPNATHDILQSKLSHVSAVDAFKAVGRFVGRALLDGQMLPLPFSPAVFKAILGVPLTLEDVEVLDPSVYSRCAMVEKLTEQPAFHVLFVCSLRYILEHDDIDALALTFSITERRGDRVDEVDLIPRGSLKGVTYIPGAYPTVHACFNRIDLPLYPRKDLLVEALQMLLLSNPTGFDIA